jgi:hypothetical protein
VKGSKQSKYSKSKVRQRKIVPIYVLNTVAHPGRDVKSREKVHITFHLAARANLRILSTGVMPFDSFIYSYLFHVNTVYWSTAIYALWSWGCLSAPRFSRKYKIGLCHCETKKSLQYWLKHRWSRCNTDWNTVISHYVCWCNLQVLLVTANINAYFCL